MKPIAGVRLGIALMGSESGRPGLETFTSLSLFPVSKSGTMAPTHRPARKIKMTCKADESWARVEKHSVASHRQHETSHGREIYITETGKS